ncbi:MAG: ornithine carbamoyltransferase, partial [Pseudomonadota bacterium]
MRHFLDIAELPAEELRAIIEDAKTGKAALKAGTADKPLAGKTLAMIFEKPSTRTRVSFDVGMRQLGGETIVLSGADMQLGRDETIADTAKVLSRYVDIIMIRTSHHERLLELAEAATVPVINGLTNDTHPCQIMADIMTFEEHKGSIEGATIAWTGDGNNVLHSLLEAAPKFGYGMAIASPQGNEPEARFMDAARNDGAQVTFSADPEAAVDDADAVITDTWVSMGLEDRAQGHNVFQPYQVNEELMARAKPDAIFMHCLPAHRGEEVTDAVIDGPQSVV